MYKKTKQGYCSRHDSYVSEKKITSFLEITENREIDNKSTNR